MKQTELFYNTIDLPEKELKEAESKNKKQEDIVLDCYKKYARELTAHEVFKLTGIGCEGSVRRACTNLYKKGLLIKTDVQRPGGFNVPNYAYKIK